MTPLVADPERLRLNQELHARPFPRLATPCRAIFIAVQPEDAAQRDPDEDRARLIRLIDRHGGQHPAPDAQHYVGDLGRFSLKWEAHTEFVTYTIFADGVAEDPFSGETLSLFPEDWLADLGGRIAAAAMVRVETAPDEASAEQFFVDRIQPHFATESLAAAWVVDRQALVATDFRIHENGFARIAVIAREGTGPQRIGRIVQRLLEIEAYKAFSLTALPAARRVNAKVTEIEAALAPLISPANADAATTRERLASLTALSAEAERISVETSFRFGAANAYAAIVNDRIAVLREERMRGRQLYSEFMKRRFDPAVRTWRAAESRLTALSGRLSRASALLSTQVNVAVEAQNQKVLESMDRRAALQLRLQQTVEGLSVVAISYYALNLAAYLLAPFAKGLGVDKTTTTAALVIPVVGVVWFALHRMRRHWER